METKLINIASLKLGYPKSKNIDTSTKAIVASLDNSDSVTISKSQNSLLTDSLSLVNRKVFNSVGDTSFPTNFSQKDIVEANKRILEKSNNLSNANETINENDKNYFSPENTANRIYNFATSFYETFLAGTGKEDSEASRQEYKDIISSAIDEGFGQALDILGDLPDEVSSQVQTTHDLIFEKLDKFVKGEEQTYSQKVTEKITNKVKEIDSDKSGDLSIEETNLSQDYFNALDGDQNGKVSVDEITNEYKKLDITKDLSDDLVNTILNNSRSFSDIAKEAQSLSVDANIPLEFLVKNPSVSQSIINYSGKDIEPSFSEYLAKHPEEVKRILEDPSRLIDVIRAYKLSSVASKLQNSSITEEFLQSHDNELQNLFNNPKLIDYFKDNQDAAKRLVDSLTSSEESK